MNRELLTDGLVYVDAWVGFRQEKLDIPGIAIALRLHDELVFAKGYGFADIGQHISMTSQHIFRIASHSKTFTATAIMQLVEHSKLRLDDRVAQYVQWLQPPSPLSDVTIRQVLNHTAGFIRDGQDADYWLLEKDFPDEQQLRILTEQSGAVFSTNEHFKYSNIGYSILGLVIESASGMSYNDYVTHNIINPLELTATGPETNDLAKQRMATGYMKKILDLPVSSLPDVTTKAMSATTGFYSTAEDLSRYGAAHCLGNEQLLTDSSKREMQQPYWKVDQEDEHYGLGWIVADIGNRRMIGHGGAFPGHSTRTLIDPHEGLTVVVLINQSNGPASDIASTIVKIINFALAAPSVASRPTSISAEKFTGRFVNLWGFMDIATFGARLVAMDPEELDPVKSLTATQVEDADTLRVTATNGYAKPGEAIRFVRDSAGRAAKIISGGQSMYPPETFRQHVIAHEKQ